MQPSKRHHFDNSCSLDKSCLYPLAKIVPPLFFIGWSPFFSLSALLSRLKAGVNGGLFFCRLLPGMVLRVIGEQSTDGFNPRQAEEVIRTSIQVIQVERELLRVAHLRSWCRLRRRSPPPRPWQQPACSCSCSCSLRCATANLVEIPSTADCTLRMAVQEVQNALAHNSKVREHPSRCSSLAFPGALTASQ